MERDRERDGAAGGKPLPSVEQTGSGRPRIRAFRRSSLPGAAAERGLSGPRSFGVAGTDSHRRPAAGHRAAGNRKTLRAVPGPGPPGAGDPKAAEAKGQPAARAGRGRARGAVRALRQRSGTHDWGRAAGEERPDRSPGTLRRVETGGNGAAAGPRDTGGLGPARRGAGGRRLGPGRGRCGAAGEAGGAGRERRAAPGPGNPRLGTGLRTEPRAGPRPAPGTARHGARLGTARLCTPRHGSARHGSFRLALHG